MAPAKRTLLRVKLEEGDAALGKVVEQLMGNKPEERFRFITDRAEFVDEGELDV
jgi:topoisomerase-4 subunit B